MQLEKFAFRIRSRNGVLIEHLSIQATDAAEARAKLLRMYPGCEILATSQEATSSGHTGTSFEDIADLLNH